MYNIFCCLENVILFQLDELHVPYDLRAPFLNIEHKWLSRFHHTHRAATDEIRTIYHVLLFKTII